MTSKSSYHPLDLLEAFALHALEPLEEGEVQDHVDGCPSCWGVVETHQQTTAFLAQAVGSIAAPEFLRARVFNSLPSLQPAPVLSAPVGPVPDPSFLTLFLATRWARWLMPATAALAVALVIFTVTVNVRLSSRVSEMERENLALQIRLDSSNATTTAHFDDMAGTGAETISGIQQLREASYAAAQPGNQSLLLTPLTDGSPSQGILMVAPDGRAAVLMVSGMDPSMTAGYQVWLERGGESQLAGTVNVDSAGWGAVKLSPQEPVLSFDTVSLTNPDNMVLEASLASAALPQRMVSLGIGP